MQIVSPSPSSTIYRFLFVAAAVTTAATVRGQGFVEECPETNGLYADAVQCDRYYECKDRQITVKLCPDGLVFDETSIAFAKCSFPFSVNCTDRPELQKPKSTRKCPRQNGYFAHENPEICDQFYFCVDGVGNTIICPESLIFNPKTGQCAYSDQIDRPGCSSTDFFGFTCPRSQESRHAHPRYPDPSDCQYFYLCINGKDARRNGCQAGFVFNRVTSTCDKQENLEPRDHCKNWYNKTTLALLGVGASKPGGFLPGGIIPARKSGTGIPLDTSSRKRVSLVIKKRPRPQQLQTAGAGGIGESSLHLLQQQAPVRQRVRTPPRVNFKQQQQQGKELASGRPQFTLSDDEAIERFREQNRLVPRGQPAASATGGSRLTVLSAGGLRSKPPSQGTSMDERHVELGPDRVFSGFRNRNRFKSRSHPSLAQKQKGLSEATVQGADTQRSRIPVEPQSDLEAASSEEDVGSFFDNFEPLKQHFAGQY